MNNKALFSPKSEEDMECATHKAAILYQEQHRPGTKQLWISPQREQYTTLLKEFHSIGKYSYSFMEDHKDTASSN